MREEGEKGKVTKKRINKNISKRIRKRMHRIGMERKRLRRDVRKIEEERRYDKREKGCLTCVHLVTRAMIYREEVLMRFKNNGDYPHYSLAI